MQKYGIKKTFLSHQSTKMSENVIFYQKYFVESEKSSNFAR
jgi:hypothetical protein